jgi:PPOX class probable F420-dependent enzyme
MKKIPNDDKRAQYKSSNVTVGRSGLDAFMAGRNKWVLSTTRADGRPQMSLVTGGMTADGELAISTYPSRVKARNVRKDPNVSVAVLGDEFNDSWVQIDGTARVIDMPDAAEAFVSYYRCISGEHPNWDEYRLAMADQGKCMIVIHPTRWSPVSRGGFPPELFESP